MPKGVYKRTKEEIQRMMNNLSKNPFSWKGKKRPPRSQKWIENAKIARKKHPIRNWKGGVSLNKDYVSWRKNRRNIIKKILNKNGSSHTFGEWELLKKQYNLICPSCGESEPEIKLTKDHIIPLSKGGSDNIENIQPLCKKCNCKKYTKRIKY